MPGVTFFCIFVRPETNPLVGRGLSLIMLQEMHTAPEACINILLEQFHSNNARGAYGQEAKTSKKLLEMSFPFFINQKSGEIPILQANLYFLIFAYVSPYSLKIG